MKKNKIHSKIALLFTNLALSFIIPFIIFFFCKFVFKDNLFSNQSFYSFAFLRNNILNLLNNNFGNISFDYYLGSNSSYNLAYSFYNPFNLIFFLFGRISIESVICVVSVKIFASIFFLSLLLKKIFNSKNITIFISSLVLSLLLSLFVFALDGYFFLDSVIAILIILMGVYYSYQKNRIFLVAGFSYLFITQFYQCVFVLIFCVFIIVFEFVKKRKFFDKEIFINQMLCILAALFVSAFAFLPSIFYLLSQKINLIVALDMNKTLWSNVFVISSVIICFSYNFFEKFKKSYYRIILLLSIIIEMLIISLSLFMRSDNLFSKNINLYFCNNGFVLDKSYNHDFISEDDLFYRELNKNSFFLNCDTIANCYGLSDYSMLENSKIKTAISKLGFATGDDLIDDTGYNPVTSSLFGFNYIMDWGNQNDYDRELKDNNLAIGYISSPNIILCDLSSENAFENINNLTNSISGIEESCFYKINDADIIINGKALSESILDKSGLSFDSTNSLFIQAVDKNNQFDSIFVQIKSVSDEDVVQGVEVKGARNIGYYYFCNNLSTSATYEMTLNDNSDKYELELISTLSEKDIRLSEIYVYGYKETSYIKHYDELSKNQLNIKKINNKEIVGEIDVTGDNRLLLTTIPFDPGWKVYLNECEIEPIRIIDGAFIGIFVPNESFYTVKLEYECPGRKMGIVISLLGLLMLFSIAFEKKLKIRKE